MLVALALRSIMAAAVVVAPAETVPVQRPSSTPGPTSAPSASPAASPTSTSPVGAPPSAVVPAPGSASGWDSRGYAGIESMAGIAPATPEVAPPPVTPPVSAPPPEPDPEVEGPIEDEGPAYDPLVDSPEAIRARSWLNAGIVFTVVGGVLAIGGIAMATAKVNRPGDAVMSCDPRQDAAGNGCLPDSRNRSAAAMAVPGTLLLIGGVTMMVVGKRQQARLRAGLQADRRGFMLGASLRF